MCNYCKINPELLDANYSHLAKIEVGRLGYYELTLTYDNVDEEGEEPRMTLDLTECTQDDCLIHQETVKINYCPFCGRKI